MLRFFFEKFFEIFFRKENGLHRPLHEPFIPVALLALRYVGKRTFASVQLSVNQTFAHYYRIICYFTHIINNKVIIYNLMLLQ